MKMKKALTWMMPLLLVIGFIAGCQKPGGSSDSSGTNENGKVSFEFWAAPNPSQVAFWKEMAKEYMKTNKNVDIKVTQMPESPTSEAGIQTALASGTAPAISENISRGFGAQLAANQAIVPLDSLESYQEVIKSRNMEDTISPWEFSDGHQYVIPLYSNPMLFGWRMDILKKLGINEPPQTFKEVIEVGEKVKQQFPDKFLWAREALVKKTWWERWFDFFLLYDSASGGQAFIKGNEFTADDEAGIKTLDFLHQLSQKKLLLTQKSKNPFVSGLSVWATVGPWSFSAWNEKFPDFKLNQNYVLSMPPVPEGVDPSKAKTFADSKGLVIYKQASEAQQKAAMDFVKWVLSDPEHDLTWFKKTNLPPARDDLNSNEAFSDFLKSHPSLQKYAKNISNAIPSIDNPKTVEIQTILSKAAVNPVVELKKKPEKAWKDMKQKISGVLGNE